MQMMVPFIWNMMILDTIFHNFKFAIARIIMNQIQLKFKIIQSMLHILK